MLIFYNYMMMENVTLNEVKLHVEQIIKYIRYIFTIQRVGDPGLVIAKCNNVCSRVSFASSQLTNVSVPIEKPY